MKGNLTDNELSIVSEAISVGMGLGFPRERFSMLSYNLTSAATEFGYNNINAFIQWLLSAPLSKEQMEILAFHLTVSETYFWREPQVFAALTDFLLPELIKSKKKRDRSIRIWSAGCSTGEEPYSIAIALHKTIPKINDWHITILATDINTKALCKAKTGVYGSGSFRNSPSWFKSSYFKSTNNKEYEIIPEIKNMVTFSGCNLTENNYLSVFNCTGTMDIIFCRNVLMYFTHEWAGKISQNLVHSLSENGWLIVSSSELSMQLFADFTPVNFPGAILYQKTNNQSANTYNIHFDRMSNPLSGIALAKESFQPSSTLFDPLQQLSSEAFLTTKVSAKVAARENLQSIVKIPQESYADKTLAIRLLANTGHLVEALLACDDAISLYKLTPGLYFLRASILQELDKSHEAIKSLKQAIYIDPDYIMGHFTLGNLFFRQGNIKNAKRYFNNALDLLNTSLNDDIPAESEGLSVQYIREIILTSLQTQKPI